MNQKRQAGSAVNDRLVTRVSELMESASLQEDLLLQAVMRTGMDDWETPQPATGPTLRTQPAALAASGQCSDSYLPESGILSFEVSPDGMTVWMSLRQPEAGPAYTRTDVFDGLQAANVVYGINDAVIDVALSSRRVQKFLVARGRPPRHGNNSTFTSLLTFREKGRPKALENGRVDLFDLGFAETVKAGQPLLHREPPTPGVPGQTVRGETIPARDGKVLPFADNCVGVAVNPDDPDQLIATQGGTPKQSGDNGVHVLPVLTVDNVDVSTGHIDFDGSVIVRKSVASGFRVHAGGDIHVMGRVEAADLSAKGDIRIDEGLIGQSKASVRAYGSIFARFIESAALVHAGGDVVVKESIINSQVISYGRVVATGAAREGQIIGGSTAAGTRIETGILGAVSSPRTDVEVATIDFDGLVTKVRQRLHGRRYELDAQEPGSKTYDQISLDIQLLTQMERRLVVRARERENAGIVASDRVYSNIRVQVQEKFRHIQADVGPAMIRLNRAGSDIILASLRTA